MEVHQLKLRDFIATYDFSDGQDIVLMELGRTVEIIRDDPVSLQCAYSYMGRGVLRHSYDRDSNRIIVQLAPER